MQKILIIDDAKNIRLLLQTCLEAAGYYTQTTGSGDEALILLKTEIFDLVFLDVKIPELSGTEVLRRMREQEIKTPVIIMTAFATIKNAVECTKLGAVTYLQKPFTADRIRKIVAEVLSSPVEPYPSTFCSIRDLITEGKFSEADQMLKVALVGNPLSEEVYDLLGQLSSAQGDSAASARYNAIAEQLRKFDN